MKTEQEARKCWCPFDRSYLMHDTDEVRCIASDCMAWRWDRVESDRQNIKWSTLHPMQKTPAEQESFHGPCPAMVGYCGLAGKP